jgi:P2 family phage contractile tail tube protein
MAINLIPQQLINSKVYVVGADLIGMGDVELPDVEHMSETMSGSGMGGEYDSPTIGHVKGMKAKFKFRAAYGTNVALIKPTPTLYDIRASIQALDAATSAYVSYPVRAVINAVPMKKAPGKMEPGKKMDSDLELSVSYYKLIIDGKEVLEVDQLNFIFKVEGEDFLASVRSHLGMTN